MPELDRSVLKNLRRGEIIGDTAVIFCALFLLIFIVSFTLGQIYGIDALRIAAFVSAALLTVAAGVSAYCNIKYGGALDKVTDGYVKSILMENAALMHPEKDTLSYSFTVTDASVIMKVNNFKEPLIIDLTPFGKLSLKRKASVCTAVETRLCKTFCRLAERGAKYKSVSYVARASSGKKGKEIFIIKNGEPEKKALKIYFKEGR